MQKRIIISVILSISIILTSLGIISYRYVKDSIDRSLQSRLALANIVSRYFDDILESNLQRLYDISISGKIDFSDNDWGPEKKALKTAYEYSIFTDRIMLINNLGNVVLTYPHLDAGNINLLSIPYVSRVLSERKQIISDIYNHESLNKKVIYTLVPLRDRNGNFIGAAVGEINPTNYIFTQIIESIPTEPHTQIELIDGRGTIIASNEPSRILTSSDHNEFLSNLIANKKTTVSTCHRCHMEDADKPHRTEDMLAFSPLSVASWGISVREPQEIVFLPATKLKYGFIILGLVAIVTALVLAIGMTRSIVKPIHILIGATRRIGQGDLSHSVQVSSKDEIGALSQSFDKMRIRLANSLKQIKNHNIELEKRVLERTNELQRNRMRLAKLFEQVIKAQEDERKRIARELHDETSQTLAALGMSIDIAELALREKSLAPAGMQELKRKLTDILDGISLLIRDLRPPVLDDLGLESGIRWLMERHLGVKAISYYLFVSDSYTKMMSFCDPAMKSTSELMLFRVIQEAIINIAKHAYAWNVAVYICANNNHVNIVIEDDGIGFDVKEVFMKADRGDNSGFGILGMQERIALLDGELNICSEPHNGTVITIDIPCISLGVENVEC